MRKTWIGPRTLMLESDEEPDPNYVPPPSVSRPSKREKERAEFQIFEESLSELYRKYGAYPEIGRVYLEGHVLLDLLKNSEEPFIKKAEALYCFQAILKKEIQNMEDDRRIHNLEPDRQANVSERIELLHRMENILLEL